MTYAPKSAIDIRDGLDIRPMASLTDEQRRLFVVLLARVSERSYRRGLQQGAEMPASRPLREDLHAWRYSISTDASHYADAPAVDRSVDRLFTENPGLSALGLTDDIRATIHVDPKMAAAELTKLVGAHRDTLGGRNGVPSGDIPTADTIRGFGAALYAAGGGALMELVYDLAAENGGTFAVQYVSPLWTGIGSWSA